MIQLFCCVFIKLIYNVMYLLDSIQLNTPLVISRGVTIRYPHDTIRIAILESRYDTYRDTW